MEIYSENYTLDQAESETFFQTVQTDAMNQVELGSFEIAENEVVPAVEAVKMWTEGCNLDLR